jgi:type III secretion protein R
MDKFQDPSSLLMLLVVISLVPFVAIMSTSFVKLAVVFSILRNALGLQSIPPNMAIYGLAIILTVYIMAPVGVQIGQVVQEKQINVSDIQNLKEHLPSLVDPVKQFLKKHTTPNDRQFFLQTAYQLWPAEQAKELNEDSLMVLIPAFTVAELTAAFQIGFLIYLPFLVVDLIVSNILLALGMMMVSPMTISLPFKLLLFVLIDGWAKLIHNLVLSYQ